MAGKASRSVLEKGSERVAAGYSVEKRGPAAGDLSASGWAEQERMVARASAEAEAVVAPCCRFLRPRRESQRTEVVD